MGKKRNERPAGASRGQQAPSRRSLPKRLLFHAVTVALFFGLLEMALAVLGIQPVLVEKDPYVGFSSRLPLFEPVGDTMRTARNKLGLFNDQTFPRRKARGTFRIFTLGGSCTYGRPFDDATSFSGWLRTYLEALEPGRWEVVNAGGISYASYRVASLMEELVEYDPDLFVIYSGHNEFLERRTYGDLIEEPRALTATKLLLQRSRLWALGRRVVERRQREARQRYELTGEVEELLESSAGLDYYHRDDAFRRQVLQHYRYNLQRMITLARLAGARVILVTVPVNEKDFSPFKSEHREGLAEASRARHAELVEGAVAALDAGETERADELAEEAVRLDPLHAEGHYRLGRALSAQGRHEEAAEEYARAIDQDVCPLRALEETNQSIHAAARRDGVPLVDYRRLLRDWMREHHGHANLGDELLLDHAHPSVEAHGILAGALVVTLNDIGLLSLDPSWQQELEGRVEAEVLARVDAEAQARAYKNLSKVLLWAGKEREAEKYIGLAAGSLGADWELHYNAGRVHFEAESYEQAIASLREAVRLNPDAAAAHDLLAGSLAAIGDLDAAILEGRRAVAADPEMAGAWSNLGTYYGARGDLQQALEASRRAVRIAPSFAEGHNSLGKALFDLGHLEDALPSFERAIELRPRYLEAMVNRGLLLGELGRFREALDAFSRVVSLEPELAAAHTGRGKALLGLGDAAAASRELERAVELDAGQLEVWELLVLGLSPTEPARAEELLGRALVVHPRAGRLHQLRARLLARQGRLEEAASSLVRAVELQPGLLAARMDLGNLRMAQGRTQDAVDVFRSALEVAPTDHRIHHVLASAFLVSGQIEGGRLHLERALEIDPGNAMVAKDLAIVYERQGRLRDALALYRRAASADPGLEAAREGASRLSDRLEDR